MELECVRTENEKLKDEVEVRIQEYKNMEKHYARVVEAKKFEFNLQLKPLDDSENIAPTPAVRPMSPGLRTLSSKIAPTHSKRPAKRKTPKKCGACHFEVSKYLGLNSDGLLQVTLSQAKDIEEKLKNLPKSPKKLEEPVADLSGKFGRLRLTGNPQLDAQRIGSLTNELNKQVDLGSTKLDDMLRERDALEKQVNETCLQEAKLERNFKELLEKFQHFADETERQQ